MVLKNIFDVLPDGMIAGMVFTVKDIFLLQLHRTESGDSFGIESVQVQSDNAEKLRGVLEEVNGVLIEHGIVALNMKDVSGETVRLNIKRSVTE